MIISYPVRLTQNVCHYLLDEINDYPRETRTSFEKIVPDRY